MANVRFTRSLVPLLILLLSGALEGEDKAPEIPAAQYRSPQEVFDAYRAAGGERNWRECFSCLTPHAQAEALFECVFALGMVGPRQSEASKAIHDRFIVDSESVDDEYRKKYKEKHGIDVDTAKQRRDAGDDSVNVPDRDLLRDILVLHVRDKAGFYEAAQKVIRRGEAITPIGELKDVKIDGDAATGQAEIIVKSIQSDRGQKDKTVESKAPKTFNFRKVDGSWLMGT